MQAALPPPYFAEIGERVWVEVSQRFIEPDASVFRGTSADDGAVAVVEPRGRPVVVTVPHDERREPRVEIRMAGDGDERLITAIEILSPSTSVTDRITKNREYRQTPSINRYVILEQTSQAATVYTRAGTDWNAEVIVGEMDLALPEIGISVPLSELYQGVEFPPQEDRAEAG